MNTYCIHYVIIHIIVISFIAQIVPALLGNWQLCQFDMPHPSFIFNLFFLTLLFFLPPQGILGSSHIFAYRLFSSLSQPLL